MEQARTRFGEKVLNNDGSLAQVFALMGECFARQAKIARKKNKLNNQLKNK